MDISRLLGQPAFALVVGTAFLTGCAMPGAQRHGMDHHASNMDMASMCEMHKREMQGKTTAQQQAMMEEHMKSMPPEMRQRMQAMHANCK